LTFIAISVIVFSSVTEDGFEGLFTFSSLIFHILWFSSIIYFILLIRSFSKSNIENKYFKGAFYLNLIWIIGAILFFFGTIIFFSSLSPVEAFDSMDKLNQITSKINYFVGFIYLISFFVFLISYFKNKKIQA